jgi:hypothetical protein
MRPQHDLMCAATKTSQPAKPSFFNASFWLSGPATNGAEQPSRLMILTPTRSVHHGPCSHGNSVRQSRRQPVHKLTKNGSTPGLHKHAKHSEPGFARIRHQQTHLVNAHDVRLGFGDVAHFGTLRREDALARSSITAAEDSECTIYWRQDEFELAETVRTSHLLVCVQVDVGAPRVEVEDASFETCPSQNFGTFSLSPGLVLIAHVFTAFDDLLRKSITHAPSCRNDLFLPAYDRATMPGTGQHRCSDSVVRCHLEVFVAVSTSS